MKSVGPYPNLHRKSHSSGHDAAGVWGAAEGSWADRGACLSPFYGAADPPDVAAEEDERRDNERAAEPPFRAGSRAALGVAHVRRLPGGQPCSCGVADGGIG